MPHYSRWHTAGRFLDKELRSRRRTSGRTGTQRFRCLGDTFQETANSRPRCAKHHVGLKRTMRHACDKTRNRTLWGGSHSASSAGRRRHEGSRNGIRPQAEAWDSDLCNMASLQLMVFLCMARLGQCNAAWTAARALGAIVPQSGRSSLVLSMMVEKVSTTPLMARKRSMTLSSSSVESVLSMAHRS